jgi:hypothetical protein
MSEAQNLESIGGDDGVECLRLLRSSEHGGELFCQRKCTVVRKKENGIGACQSMEGNVVAYIHHGAALLPVLLPALLPVPLI